jgi:hypothetical protein
MTIDGTLVGAKVGPVFAVVITASTLVTEVTDDVIKSDNVVPEFKLEFTVDAKLEADDSPITVKSATISQLTVQV